MFCPKCGSLMIPKRSGGKSYLACSCGYVDKERNELILREKTYLGKKIEVIDQKIETLPKTEEKCEKCGNNEAYYWVIQTRSGDEAETRFFRCTKCEHVWRSYS